MEKKSRLKKFVLILLLIILTILGVGYFLLKSIFGELWVFSTYIDEILGFDEEKHYLILFQNNNELRPTGGFISAYGFVKLQNGKYDFEFADSYNLPNIENLNPAPEAFEKLLKDDPKFKGWYFRDGNFNVDFSKAAKDLEELYNQQSGNSPIAFDGIFGINFELIEDLVEIYHLQIGEKTLDKKNLFALLENEVKNIDTHNIETLENRKSILKELANKLIKEISTSISKYDIFFETIRNGLNQKKILLSFKNQEIQKIVEEKNWGGQFNPNNYRNFIYSNIANIGGRKEDRYIRKTHEYFVSFNNSGVGKVKYTITLEHLGTKNANSDIYKGYIRVFIPKNAKAISHNPDKDYLEEYTRKINPGEETSLEFEYFLPEEINMQNFVLDIIKQPGTKDFWKVAIQLPSDNSILSDEFETHENLATWSAYLSRDKHFDFEYIEDKLPPLILWQEFIKLNEIEIAFGEEINEKLALNPDNYEIKDLNYINKQTDTVKVKQVKFNKENKMTLLIETDGISRANEERYNLILKNIEDKYKNQTKPNPLELTLVQRL